MLLTTSFPPQPLISTINSFQTYIAVKSDGGFFVYPRRTKVGNCAFTMAVPRSLILDRTWDENIPIFKDMALQFFDTDKYGKFPHVAWDLGSTSQSRASKSFPASVSLHSAHLNQKENSKDVDYLLATRQKTPSFSCYIQLFFPFLKNFSFPIFYRPESKTTFAERWPFGRCE